MIGLLAPAMAGTAKLTTLCMNEPEIVVGLAIRGIYDLQPVRLSYLNVKLQLSPDDVAVLTLCQRSAQELNLVAGSHDLCTRAARGKGLAHPTRPLPRNWPPGFQHPIHRPRQIRTARREAVLEVTFNCSMQWDDLRHFGRGTLDPQSPRSSPGRGAKRNEVQQVGAC